MTFILLVGQNAWQGPATANDAAQYKSSHGYQSGWRALADPHWSATDNAIYDPSGTLPSFIVLDGQMTLLYSGSGWVSSAEDAIISALN